MASADDRHDDEHRDGRPPDRVFWDGWMHEARTGLQVILGRAQLLRRRVDGHGPLRRRDVGTTLHTIEAAAHRMAQQVERLDQRVNAADDSPRHQRPPRA